MSSQRILVVDDEPANTRLLESLLGRWGYAVTTTNDSDEALGLVVRTDPDLVLLDLTMPPPDGFELLRVLPGASSGPPLPINAPSRRYATTGATPNRACACAASTHRQRPIQPTSATSRSVNRQPTAVRVSACALIVFDCLCERARAPPRLAAPGPIASQRPLWNSLGLAVACSSASLPRSRVQAARMAPRLARPPPRPRLSPVRPSQSLGTSDAIFATAAACWLDQARRPPRARAHAPGSVDVDEPAEVNDGNGNRPRLAALRKHPHADLPSPGSLPTRICP
jgi:CheY-like chemotaxis protein